MNSVDDEKEQASTRVRPSPLYVQLVHVFSEYIRRKEWKMGASLPSEANLARTYGVSVGTMRKALMELERAGLIERRQGRGTFVASPFGNFSHRIQNVGLKEERTMSAYSLGSLSIVSDESGEPSAAERYELQLNDFETVRRLTAQLKVNGQAILVEQAIMPLNNFDVQTEALAYDSLFEGLLISSSLPTVECRELISICEPPQIVSKVMELQDGQWLLKSRAILKSSASCLAIFDRFLDCRFAEFRSDFTV